MQFEKFFEGKIRKMNGFAIKYKRKKQTKFHTHYNEEDMKNIFLFMFVWQKDT